MKPNSLPQYAPRRPSTFTPSDPPSPLRSLLWLSFHALCCLVSLSSASASPASSLFLLLSSPSPPSLFLPSSSSHLNLTANPNTNVNPQSSRVVVGRHGIHIRPWPHPDPSELMTAHSIIARVQLEQRSQYGVKNPRPLIAITPTHSRTFQSLHLTGLIHSLMLLPYPLTWIVVEAPSTSNDTASLLARSNLTNIIHIPFRENMPADWATRHRTEARMRLRALREVRERRLDGIVVFTDDSNMHSMEMFDEIQKVNWFGSFSIGILAHSGNADPAQQAQDQQVDAGKENMPLPVQGPACNSSGSLVGWHTFNTLPYSSNSAIYVGDAGVVLPARLEWSGFVLNSRLLWKDEEERPEWVRDLDELEGGGEVVENPLGLLKDTSFVEPLGNCGKKVLLWWLRVEARLDSKFPPGWIIDPPLVITVPAKRTPWPDAPPELPLTKAAGNTDKHSRTRSSRPRRSSRGKRRHESHVDTQNSGASQTQTIEQ